MLAHEGQHRSLCKVVAHTVLYTIDLEPRDLGNKTDSCSADDSWLLNTEQKLNPSDLQSRFLGKLTFRVSTTGNRTVVLLKALPMKCSLRRW
jgi:hypothetical protein